MNKSATTYAQSLTMSREEKRLERAHASKAWHAEKIRREKAWLAANPHIAAQRQREKEFEEQQRVEARAQREIARLKAEAERALKPNKPKSGAFSALMSDSDEDTESDKEIIVETMVAKEEPKEKPDEKIRQIYKPMSYEGSIKKKLNWADSDSDDEDT
jgi:hypothetical protein